MEPPDPDRTERALAGLFARIREGDGQARTELYEALYGELRAMAQCVFASSAGPAPERHTLRPTAVLHDAWIRTATRDLAWQDETHFRRSMVCVMRHILVDHARHKYGQAAGGPRRFVALDEAVAGRETAEACGLVELDEALRMLFGESPDLAALLDLHVFGGLTQAACAELLGLTRWEVERDLRRARARLRELL